MRLGMRSALPSPMRTSAAVGPGPSAPGSPAPPGRARPCVGADGAFTRPNQPRRSASAAAAGLSSSFSCTPAGGTGGRLTLSVRRRWSRTSVSSKAWPGRVQPRASSSRRSRQPSMASNSSPAWTPARSAAPPRSTLLTWMPLSAPSLTAQAELGRQVHRLRLPAHAARASSAGSGRSSVPCTQAASSWSSARPATCCSACAMSASSMAPPPERGPQLAHHLVEGAWATGAQAQVQRQRHQAALGVVADGGVGRVLVAAVVLDPGIEAGFGHALRCRPAWPSTPSPSWPAGAGSAARRSARRAAAAGRRSRR